MPTITLPTPAPVPLRSDATVIGLVGLAHGISHFSQLLLPPLFPWLKDAFGASYTELGALLTIFFVVSCIVQTLSGFWVDRYGPRPILFTGLALVGTAALGFSISTSYWMLAFFAVIAGTGNGVFHPVDYTILNRKISKQRLGHAYSVHGITGSLGWALAPAMLVPIALASGWRTALVCAAALAFAVLAVLVLRRDALALTPAAPAALPAGPAAGAVVEGSLDFLRIPAVWMCFAFFFFYAGALSVVQTFGPAAAGHLHEVPLKWVALCLTIYMVCSACGMVLGGFLASDPARSERIVGVGFALAAMLALCVALLPVPGALVPVLFGLMGFVSGSAGPSRDLLVKRSTPDNATGRVYGLVYAGLDIGQAVVPLFIGALMDHGDWRGVWLALAALHRCDRVGGVCVDRVRRTALVLA